MSLPNRQAPVVAPRLILVQLNELCLDLAARYASTHRLPAFEKLLRGDLRTTVAEPEYDLLEPWVQWFSVYTGQTAREHGLFRLGDAVGHPSTQIFEHLERAGFSVGAVAPFNAENRLRTPSYFLADPWTATSSDPSIWSQWLGSAVSALVNDNARGRADAASLAKLLAGWMRFARPKNYLTYVHLASTAAKAPWRRALFLDLLLHDLHWTSFEKYRPQFSTLFLNAGAHIQHHYLFNSTAIENGAPTNPTAYIAPWEDPVAEAMVVYDRILGDLLARKDTELIVATGLSQSPYPRLSHYWRLKDHAQFLAAVGVHPARVLPRMSRDFLVEFSSRDQAHEAAKVLTTLCVQPGGERLFGVVDNRGLSLFCTLTYAGSVDPGTSVIYRSQRMSLDQQLVHVAVKNGMHQSRGYAHFSPGLRAVASPDDSHISSLHGSICRYFGVNCANPAPTPELTVMRSSNGHVQSEGAAVADMAI